MNDLQLEIGLRAVATGYCTLQDIIMSNNCHIRIGLAVMAGGDPRPLPVGVENPKNTDVAFAINGYPCVGSHALALISYDLEEFMMFDWCYEIQDYIFVKTVKLPHIKEHFEKHGWDFWIPYADLPMLSV